MKKSRKQICARRSESEIRTMLKEQETSNVTVKEFCEIYDIHEATYYNWRNRYGSKVEKTGKFIEMEIGQIARESSLFAEIELSGKLLVRIFQKVDPSYFKGLL
jgi:transposase-like protein